MITSYEKSKQLYDAGVQFSGCLYEYRWLEFRGDVGGPFLAAEINKEWGGAHKIPAPMLHDLIRTDEAERLCIGIELVQTREGCLCVVGHLKNVKPTYQEFSSFSQPVLDFIAGLIVREKKP